MDKQHKRNQYFFGLGTVGRDMFYAFEANAILYFLSDVLSLPLWVFAITTMLSSRSIGNILSYVLRDVLQLLKLSQGGRS